jgi:hypothetical protein
MVTALLLRSSVVTSTVSPEVAEGHPEVPEIGEAVLEGLLKSPP